MTATQFEYRHPVLIHRLLVAAAFSTYFVQRDDMVWQFVKTTGEHAVVFERILFTIATLMVGAAAIACTRFGGVQQVSRGHPIPMGAENRPRRPYASELLYAAGLGSLAPVSGFVILVAGETLRVFRWNGRNRELSSAGLLPTTAVKRDRGRWHELRGIFAKWGIFFTMIVFTITLKDRVAEVLASVVFLIAIVLDVAPTSGG